MGKVYYSKSRFRPAFSIVFKIKLKAGFSVLFQYYQEISGKSAR